MFVFLPIFYLQVIKYCNESMFTKSAVGEEGFDIKVRKNVCSYVFNWLFMIGTISVCMEVIISLFVFGSGVELLQYD